MPQPQLDDKIGVQARLLHASTARFVDMAASCDDSGARAGIGMRSCAHWLTITTGIDLWNARETLRVGHAVRELPAIREAFASGQLSFDKVRAVTLVATAADEAIWLELALEASGAQLSRICREFRRSVAVDDPRRAELQRARRRVVSWWLDDEGMLALYATLPPEEGRLVLNAIESAVLRPTSASSVPGCRAAEPRGDDAQSTADPDDGDRADHPHGARRADALVRICERWLDDTAAAAPRGTATAELVVHVDAGVLTGADAGGRCHLDGGPAISAAAARRVGCDADVVTVVEREGVPVDVSRSRRLVSGRMRRLLQLRDGGCRYPGCEVPAADTEGHHVVHWVDGGPTELANLVSLCRFHHHRHHEGAFRVAAGSSGRPEAGRFRFETAGGLPIGQRRPDSADVRWLRDPGLTGGAVARSTPRARGGGQSFDLDHTVLVLASNIAIAAARGANPMASGP